ncbi:MAG: NADPH-dependent F420 reductase [Phycisphaerales bacterium]
MRIAIIGAGGVGRTLGRGWARCGHDIVYGVRDVQRAYRRGLESTEKALSVPEAARQAEIIVLATPWETTRDAVEACGNFGGRVLLDCTNPLLVGARELARGYDTSGGELVASWAQDARVVKAFNTVGVEVMADPAYEADRAAIPVCGDDEEARRVVIRLAEELGFVAVDAGPLHAARWTEPLAMLWTHLALERGLGRDVAFKLLTRAQSTR